MSTHEDGGGRRHVLFLGASQKSHLIHMQGLVEEMAARGHEVTFAALETDRSMMTSAGVQFLSAGEPEHDAGYYGYTHDILDLFRLSSDYSVHLYTSLFPKLKDKDAAIDLVVFDHLFWPAGHALSRDLDARGVMLFPGLFGLQHLGMEPDYVPMIISGFQSPVIGNLPNRIQNFAMLRVARIVLQVARARIFRSALEKLHITDGSNPYGKTKLALHGSFKGLGEVSRDQLTLDSPMVQSTGPWLPRSTSMSNEVETFLGSNGGPPVAFIAIGTNADWTSDMTDVFVGAFLDLNKTKDLKVLWSIKEKGASEFLDPALKRASTSLDALSDTLKVVPFVDQLAVLQSDSVAAFVSHCGFGSMQEALFTGKPVLAMPMMLESDQVTNAARLVQMGVAESFDRRAGKDEITTKALLAKLRALTAQGDDNSYKSKADSFSRISHRLQGPKRAADWLEIEMETSTQFMVGTEEKLSWMEQNSFDVYAVFTLLALVAYFAVSKLIRRQHHKAKED